MEYLARIALEHQGIQQMLQVQRELLERMKKAKGVNIVHLNNLLAFWRDFLNQEHMNWEEEFAFAAFRKLNHSLPDRLQGEHEQIRASLAKLEATMRLLRSGRPHSGREYVQWGEELTETVEDHLARENTALRELSLSGLEMEAVQDHPSEGPSAERMNHLVTIAEELCQEYLQKETALRPLYREAKSASAEVGPQTDDAVGDLTLTEEELGQQAGAGPGEESDDLTLGETDREETTA